MSSSPRRTRRPHSVLLAVLATVLLGVGATGCAAASTASVADAPQPPVAADVWAGEVLKDPLSKPEFTLTDTDGQPYDFRAETAGKVTLLFFGYTNCPDICPVHMATIAAAMDHTGLHGGQVEVVFVTADPERDTPERLREFLDNFNRMFVGLTGDESQIVDLMRELGLPAPTRQDNPAGASQGYLVGHPAQVLAFTPDDRAHLVYPFGTRQADWVQDLPKLVGEGWS